MMLFILILQLIQLNFGLEIFSKDFQLLFNSGNHLHLRARPLIVSGEPSHAAKYVIFFFSFFFFLQKKDRIPLFLFTIIILASIDSAMGTIWFFALLISYLILTRLMSKRVNVKFIIYLLTSLLIAGLVAYFSSSKYTKDNFGMLLNLSDMEIMAKSNLSFAYRIYFPTWAIKLFFENSLFGHGPGTFLTVINSPGFVLGGTLFPHHLNGGAQSFILNLMVDFGILGVIILIVFFSSYIKFYKAGFHKLNLDEKNQLKMIFISLVLFIFLSNHIFYLPIIFLISYLYIFKRLILLRLAKDNYDG